jgi:hypothetical protein
MVWIVVAYIAMTHLGVIEPKPVDLDLPKSTHVQQYDEYYKKQQNEDNR